MRYPALAVSQTRAVLVWISRCPRPASELLKAAQSIPAGARWITINSSGKEGKGQPVLIQETSPGSGVHHVIGGAGGKLNYLKLKGVRSEDAYRQDVIERRRARTEARKEQRKLDKETGAAEAKASAKASLNAQLAEKREALVALTAKVMGWEPQQFDPTPYEDASPEAAAKAARDFQAEALRKSEAAIEKNRAVLYADPETAREAVGGAVPAESDDPGVISLADLTVTPETGGGLGYAIDYTAEAEKHGTTAADIQAETAALEAKRPQEHRDAATKRAATVAAIKTEVEAVRAEIAPKDTPTKLVAAQEVVELLKAQKELRMLEKKARAASKEIDEAKEAPGPVVLEVSPAQVDQAMIDQTENDLRTISTVGFLSEVSKIGASTAKHLGVGAYNALNAVSLAVGGTNIVDRLTMDVLGIGATARVMARRMAQDMGADEVEQIKAAVEAYHYDTYQEATDKAMADALKWEKVAEGLEVDVAKNGFDLEKMGEANRDRREAIEHARRIMGQTLGEMEANAALISELGGSRDSVEVALGDMSTEAAVKRARSIGLQAGDYEINTVDSTRFLQINARGMDRITHPIDAEAEAQTRRALEIQRGDYDETGWMSENMASRPDLVAEAHPGVADRFAEPLQIGDDIAASVGDYVAARTADGDAARDIVADLRSDALMDRAGARRSEYIGAIDAIAPLNGPDGKPISPDEMTGWFEDLAEQYVKRRYGGERSTINRQKVEVNETSVEALHRALAKVPDGIMAFKPVGDLSAKEQGLLRDYWFRTIGSKEAADEAADLREIMLRHEAAEPPKLDTNMFGEEQTSQEWEVWNNQMRDYQDRLKTMGMDWQTYSAVLGGPAKAYATMQDIIKGQVVNEFGKQYNALVPDRPLKAGRSMMQGFMGHLEAINPKERERRLEERARFQAELQEREGGTGRFAAGTVSAEMERQRARDDANKAMQIDMFGNEESIAEPAAMGDDELAASGQRVTLGHMVERTIAGMVPKVGENFRADKPVHLFHASMDGRFVSHQRSVKMLENSKRLILAAGVGCVDGGTLLDDAEGRGWTFAQWLASGLAPKVFSMHDGAIVTRQASLVFTKGVAPMFAVTIEGGRRITVTAKHRFWTPNGWSMLSDLQVGSCVSGPSGASLPVSSLGLAQLAHASGDRRSTQTGIGFLDRCLRGLRQYGARLQSWLSGDQASPPSLAGVRAHIHRCSQGDDLARATACTHSCQLSPRRTMTDFSLHAEPLGCAAESRGLSSTDELLQPTTRQVLQPLWCSFSDLRTAVGWRKCLGLCIFCGLPWRAGQVPEKLVIRFLLRFQALARHLSRCRVFGSSQRQTDTELSVFRAFAITSIVPVGYRVVYDISVSLSENYLAHGFVNHNSGKTKVGLASFAHLQAQGKAHKGIFAVPSVVVGQFSGEALRYIKPGTLKWHAEPGASREERLAAYKDPGTHFVVVTHQALRDDLLRMGADQAGITATELADQIDNMTVAERKTWMGDLLKKEGINPDFLMVDEGHNLLNRAGKKNSNMANVLDAVAHNSTYFVSASADPVKNDFSEAQSLLATMNPEKYGDAAAFKRKYGVDTVASRAELQREMARYHYPSRITSGTSASRTVRDVKLLPAQQAAIKDVERAAASARMARMKGSVDVEALKKLSPQSFAKIPEERHGEVAAKLTKNIGIIRDMAVQRAINEDPGGAKMAEIESIAAERHGKPGVIFAHSLKAVRAISERLSKAGHRVTSLTGGDDAKSKDRKRLAFHPESGEATSDILVVSDAGATGLNLQRGQWLVQYDTPMTAMGWHQRNGRIDRVGQKNNVELIDLVGDHKSERAARKRLARKDELREVLTSPLDSLDDTGVAGYIARARAKEQQQRLF